MILLCPVQGPWASSLLCLPDRMIGGIFFLSCLFICLSVVNFNLRFNFWTVRHIWHPYCTNDALSNDTNVNDLVTLTLTLKLKIAFWILLPPGHSVSQTHFDFRSFQISLFVYFVFVWSEINFLLALHYTDTMGAYCTLPKEAGNCLAYIPAWYYDHDTGTCKEFVYGGCGGNDNRFTTKDVCEASCSKDGEFIFKGVFYRLCEAQTT